LAARLYRAFMNIIDDCVALFALADEVNIIGPPAVLTEIMAKLPALVMSKAWLKTQASKNRVYVHPSARATWTSYLDDNPRNTDVSILCLHDIPDGRNPPPKENDDIYNDHSIGPTWPDYDGVNILGTPLGSPAIV